MRKKIAITRALPFDLEEILPSEQFELKIWQKEMGPTKAELREFAHDVDGLISLLTDQIDEEFLSCNPNLRAIAQYAVGVNNIDLPACAKKGIVVSNTPDVLTQATANLAFALMLSLARRIPESQKSAARGEWLDWMPTKFLGLELQGATLGIFGMGRIGQAMAELCQKSFGMKIVFSHYKKMTIKNAEQVPIEELLSQSDIVSVHAPLTTVTRDFFNLEKFSLMKEQSIFLNTARGELVKTDDLVQSLESGKFLGVGLDVTAPEPLPANSPLYQFDRVLITPHIASAEGPVRRKMAMMVAKQIKSALNNERPANLVDVSLIQGRVK